MSGFQDQVFDSPPRSQREDEEGLLVSVDGDSQGETNFTGEDNLHRRDDFIPQYMTTSPGGWKFEPMTTTPHAWVLIVVNLIMIGLVFLIPGLCDPSMDPTKETSSCYVDPLSSLIYSHAIHWTFHLFADQYLKLRHKKSRCRGYIEFYMNTKNLRRAPFYIISVGNAVLLLTVTALHDYCDSDSSSCPNKFTKVDYLRGLITLECMAIGCIWVSYIMNVREFNRKSELPDIYREEFVQEVCPENVSALNDTTEPTLLIITEKQAEIIRCMHEYVTKVNEKMSSALCSAAATHNPNQEMA